MIILMIILQVQKKLKVTNDMLSKYCSDIANKHGIRVAEVNN